MTYKELLGTVIFFILAIFALTGCEKPPLPKNRPVYFYHKNGEDSRPTTLSPELLQKGLHWFDQLGYDFHISPYERDADVVIEEVTWSEDWIGQADPNTNRIKLIRGLMGWTSHVLAHETMHLLGVGHIEDVWPNNRSCNVMNGNGTDFGCGPMDGFTDLDLELYAQQAD